MPCVAYGFIWLKPSMHDRVSKCVHRRDIELQISFLGPFTVAFAAVEKGRGKCPIQENFNFI